MNKIKQYIKEIVVGAVAIILLAGFGFLMFFQDPVPNSDQQIIDSLQTEILGLQIYNGRYEIILNELWVADSNFVMEHTKYIE